MACNLSIPFTAPSTSRLTSTTSRPRTLSVLTVPYINPNQRSPFPSTTRYTNYGAPRIVIETQEQQRIRLVREWYLDLYQRLDSRIDDYESDRDSYKIFPDNNRRQDLEEAHTNLCRAAHNLNRYMTRVGDYGVVLTAEEAEPGYQLLEFVMSLGEFAEFT